MSDPDLFPKKDEVTPPAVPDVNQLLELVKREDGTRKYNSVEELAKGAAHAQEYIKTLTEKLKAIEEGKEKAALEKILETLSTPAPAPVVPAAPAPVVTPDLAMIEQAVQRIDAKKKAEANAEAIKADLIKAAGSEAAAAQLFHDKAASVGLTTVDLSVLASKSPEAARKILGLGDSTKAPTKTTGTVFPSNVPTIPEKGPRVMLGGATSQQLVDAFRKHKPTA